MAKDNIESKKKDNRDLKIRVKYFINKRTNQISMTVQKKKSEEFIKYLPKMKQLNFLDLRLRKNG